LRAELDAAGLGDVQLLGHDHNWDNLAAPDALLSDPAAVSALAGTAWHCYAGTPTAQLALQQRHPGEGQWLTECSGLLGSRFAADLRYGAETLLVGAVRGWARSVLFWNLALDPAGGPHTGGCSNCRGVLTIDPLTGAITRNVEWDILALAGRAVQRGAVRVDSTTGASGISTVAWLNPDGTRCLIAYNGARRTRTVVVEDGDPVGSLPLPPGSVVALVY
jgi:glucosylceramidase